MLYLHIKRSRPAAAFSGNSAMMDPYIPAALSKSQAHSSRRARANGSIFFSLSAAGAVCKPPRYSHSQVAAPSAGSRSAPYILHMNTIMGPLPFYSTVWFVSIPFSASLRRRFLRMRLMCRSKSPFSMSWASRYCSKEGTVQE